MSERLIIRNFGPVKDMSFDFKKINLLIGEQSTGKSTVAKLLSTINQMPKDEKYLLDLSTVKVKDKFGEIGHFKKHLEGYQIDTYLTNSTEIIYEHPLLKFRFIDGNCSMKKLSPAQGNEVSAESLNVLFIPADRAAVNLLSNEVLYSLNEIRQDLPLYFVRFGQMFNRAKKDQENFNFADTLGVVYKYENSLDKIEILNGKLINISDASSAIQTNVPLLVLMQYQSKYDFVFPKISVSDLNITVIEELELNCFPYLQNAILKYVALCIQPFPNRFTRRILLTTHSPYILTSLNNLMYAYKVGQNHREEANKIIEEKYWVNPKDVSAYQLLSDGTCIDILDREEGMIEADRIDEVSRIINKEFDDLMDIEFVANESDT